MVEKDAEWHLNRNIIVGLIVSVGASLIMQAYQFFWIIKSLDTTPPVIERIIRLEIQTSEYGNALHEFKSTMEKLNETITQINQEQARRKPIVDSIERGLGRRNQ